MKLFKLVYLNSQNYILYFKFGDSSRWQYWDDRFDTVDGNSKKYTEIVRRNPFDEDSILSYNEQIKNYLKKVSFRSQVTDRHSYFNV